MNISRKQVVQLLLVILAGTVFSFGLRHFGSIGTRLERSSVVEAVLRDPEAPRINPAQADVTMVVFTDYQCPICRVSNRAMQKVLAEDRRVRVIFKDWPVFGKASQEAARVAIASDKQGIYAAVHDRLMQRSGPLDQAAMRSAVEAAGGNWPRLVDDLEQNGAQIDSLIARNATQAFSLGLGGTPGYLIGPFLVRGGLNESQFRKALTQARDATNSN
jgi:protein-disulfide isomerase